MHDKYPFVQLLLLLCAIRVRATSVENDTTNMMLPLSFRQCNL